MSISPQDHQLMSTLVSVDNVAKTAAETLLSLSQAGGPPQNPNVHPQLQESGPSTHPHGPPTLSHAPGSLPPSGSTDMTVPPPVNITIIGSEELVRQRKDKHKEVERRRRGNINEGINELALIVPNETGEKAKGAILSRSVQYIHQLKENEARNIGLQTQLEDMRRMYQEELHKREKAEAEIATLKAELASATGTKQPAASSEATADDEGNERGNKRPRVDA